ncbi:MAG: hypothetical protein AAF402_17105, partial [Pseudomonadota bacterium]
MKRIQYFFFLDSTGYGLSALAYISALQQHHQVQPVPLLQCPETHRYKPVRQVKDGNQIAKRILHQLFDDASELSSFDQSLSCEMVPDITVIHTIPDYFSEFRNPESRNIGITVWEYDSVPSSWLIHLDLMDALVVPSEFCKSAFEKSGTASPLFCVPHVLRKPERSPASDQTALRKALSIDADAFVFYCINDWTLRKNLRDL